MDVLFRVYTGELINPMTNSMPTMVLVDRLFSPGRKDYSQTGRFRESQWKQSLRATLEASSVPSRISENNPPGQAPLLKIRLHANLTLGH